MKKIFVTADFTTTLTREVVVEDDFDPHNANPKSIFYKGRTYGVLTKEEVDCAIANLQLDEVWLIKDEQGNDFFVL